MAEAIEAQQAAFRRISAGRQNALKREARDLIDPLILLLKMEDPLADRPVCLLPGGQFRAQTDALQYKSATIP